jgi:hypothetical protein
MTSHEYIETVFGAKIPDAIICFADLTYKHNVHAQIGIIYS